MGKIQVVLDKLVYLDQAFLDLGNVIMYQLHYRYMLPKYGENLWLCYIDTDSFLHEIKTDDFYKDIANNVETRVDTSSYSCSRPLPIGVNKKVICLKILAGKS